MCYHKSLMCLGTFKCTKQKISSKSSTDSPYLNTFIKSKIERSDSMKTSIEARFLYSVDCEIQ